MTQLKITKEATRKPYQKKENHVLFLVLKKKLTIKILKH